MPRNHDNTPRSFILNRLARLRLTSVKLSRLLDAIIMSSTQIIRIVVDLLVVFT